MSRWHAILLSACCASTAAGAQLTDGLHELGGERVLAQTVATDLNRPWGLAFLPDGSLLITEKNGGLRRLPRGGGPALSIAGLPPDIDRRMANAIDNTGLFDVAVDPRFVQTRRVFLSYASSGPEGVAALRVASFRLDGDALRDEREVVRVTPTSHDRFHYGGALLFVDEDTLLITSGERVERERSQTSTLAAQDRADLRGKILRVTRDGRPAAGNLQFADRRIYALGVRNPQGLARDPRSNLVWFSEHGPIAGDELNVLRSGANYGWPQSTCGRYKDRDYQPPLRNTSHDARPAHCWSSETVAPAGMAFYHAALFPKWQGKLIVAGLSAGRLLFVTVADEAVIGVDVELIATPTRLRDVAVAPDGSVYLAVDGEQGRIIRLTPGE